MIEYREALNICLQSAGKLPTERIAFMESLGRILAEDVVSDINMPPFDKTAVDGYACRRADLGKTLEVLEIIPAGIEPTQKISAGKCSKIMTGARVPDGADCVIMVEDVEEIDPGHIRFAKEKTANNICYLAEDVKQGTKILHKGVIIKPQDIAMFASVGYTNPLVYQKARVAVISTGNELVEPNEKPGLSKIRNSNAYQLLAQVEKVGAKANYIGIVNDNEEDLFSTISKAKQENDVVLLTGGVSMGDFDLVPKMLKETGFDIRFKSIAVQPGRPTLFGKHENKYVFGLPGNPVSSFTQFELLVKPFLFQLMGVDYQPQNLLLPLAEDYTRKKAEREKWIPGILTENGEVKPTDYHGSAHIHSLSYSEFFFRVPIGVHQIKKGAKVHVRSI
jgi:molybdopterin molybdotransferase